MGYRIKEELMYYVVLTMAMLLGDAQPGRIVITEMDTRVALPPINQQSVPLGARADYKTRAQVEAALLLFHCGAPAGKSGDSVIYECQGM
jgi:hypothetical protein